MSWLRRLVNTLRPGRLEREIDREIAFHLTERADDLRDSGLNDEQARRLARIRFGNPLAQRERTRDADIALWLDSAARNVRYAVRSLTRTPGFTAVVVLTLALAIGANSAVFSAFDAVLLRPLALPDADRLTHVSQVHDVRGETTVAPIRVLDWDRLNTTFQSITSYTLEDVSDTTGDLPEQVRRAIVLPRFLETWRVSPLLGRGFIDAEYRSGSTFAVLISERYWRRRFGADRDVLRKSVRMGDRSYAIVGVLPETFMFPERDVDWWMPTPIEERWALDRSATWHIAVGRLKPGVTIEQARADLAAVQTQLGRNYPDTDAALRVHMVPYKDHVIGNTRDSLWLIFAAVSVLLLIACTNIAALLLSRGTQRVQEVAVRRSLGASRASVIAQMLTESAVLAVCGAAAGLLVASFTSSALRRLAPELPRLEEIAVDARIVFYTTAIAAAVSMLCGLVPALRSSRTALVAGHARTRVSTRQTLQWLLVGVQITLSVMLLAGAGLLLRSVDKLSRVSAGFDATGVLTFQVSASFAEAGNYEPIVQRINRTLDELRALPGVEATASSLSLPGVTSEFQVVYRVAETGSTAIADARIVSPSYFQTLQIPLVEGELCRRPPDPRSIGEVMVNRAFADRYSPGRSVVGLHVLRHEGPEGVRIEGVGHRIAGVVADAREVGLDRTPVPVIYGCFSAPTPSPWFLVRTAADPIAIVGAVRSRMRELEPLRSVYDIASLDERIGEVFAQNRLRTWLLSCFALSALALVCAGVYGTLSYAVSVRRREVAVRLALGALRTTVVTQLMGTSIRVVAVASAIGLGLSLLFTRSLATMLYGVTPSDPATLAAVVGLVVTVAGIAAVIPATRAVLMQPMRTLREE
jgi:putative ABC transport system permease protein